MDQNVIKVGDFVIVQRQGYTKLHKLKAHGTLSLGSFTVELDNIVGEKYGATFQMKNFPGNRKLFTLEKVDEMPGITSINIEKSGLDNRNITDDGQSQNLTTEDISKLKSEELNSNSIVEKLINNSKTFNSKTEYSQEKYIKKKEKKYFEYVQIRRPTIRLLATMFYRQDPSKTLGIRIDDLSQILTYSNIQSQGTHLLYDSGTSGLLPAALLHQLGGGSPAHLIHLHPGNECQKSALVAMNFPPEQLNRCINVNLYSVLRCYYQQKETFDDPPASKKMKIEEGAVPKKPNWQMENERACQLLNKGVDSLIIASKEHPNALVSQLAQFLTGGRNLIVFNQSREPLQDLYLHLKEKLDFIHIKIVTNFMRNYQVLANRTHPEVNMTTGGYILTAFKLK
ncbi:tRNA (adenine(58)-N(1))-methyltransferase non-catalytic subunit TRM6-like Protein [Tribolium castaneum]|uniref:tRNA (adenine(58)-N(1))-methyltransferase non-catalytic subunit TRM6 n=1 Tax=Tribolium castaneum TaxID=7070 RepID=D2A3U3_TRICA|nr:PREDICTED: tRNA (adenine(58)-N(1))-methyltransferase non-catalytic subunit TRM6 [Tribolium castaneum]EFA04885.1 tRNA (adenine(58)-N(1))-methyltransferase non-catalytic subunit TRM6-like Protein [Tribolium castaneum]|eukprot:XP_008194930.1 PREDICTED: tRNA (adenine(58)-N(1))-methyltransferase non-catalytic subunit TRM6 [Tribolium castaneum]